nr:nucleoside-diphosphate kinase [Longispora albida]
MPRAERTLVVCKPDAVARGLIGRVVQRIEDAGLKIVGAKMALMDAAFTRQHYADLEQRHGAAVYAANAEAMRRGPVLALVVEGVEAVGNVRRLVGPTYPDQAPPGTVRGDFAHHSRAHCTAAGKAVANLIHASATPEEAAAEVALWFSEAELFDYTTAAELYTF